VAWFAYVSALPETQYLNLTVLIRSDEDAPVGGVRVVVFELADGGPRKLSEGAADNSDVYRTSLKLPRKPVRVESVAVEDAVARDFGFDKSEVYTAVNLWVVAYRVSEEVGKEVVNIGTLTFSVDPTFMKHPLDSATHIIRLLRVEPQKSAVSNAEGSPSMLGLSLQGEAASSCQIPAYPYQEESLACTTVLRFATWDGIEARYDYVFGSKLRIESKERYFVTDACSYTSWESCGNTIVMVEQARSSDWLTDRTVYTMNFQLKYYFIRYWPPHQSAVLVEKVYAVDTSRDGEVAIRSESDWNGTSRAGATILL